MHTSFISRRIDPLSQAAVTDRKVTEDMVAENMHQLCNRLGVRFDGEFSVFYGLLTRKKASGVTAPAS